MGSTSDYPVTPHMLNGIRQDREDVAAGRHVWTEEEILARVRQLGRERLAKARGGVTFGQDEKNLAATDEAQENRY